MDNILNSCKTRMKESIENLKHNLSGIRAGRASIGVLDRVVVDYYGTPTQIQQMAAVSIAENRILVIQPWDKSTLGDIEKALIKADIGITPNNDGNIIRLIFPQPTEERRKELCKDVRSIGEEGKVAIRGVRREANDQLKNIKSKNEVSEDDIARLEKDVQDLTDKFVKEVDEIVSAKEKEVLEI